MPFFNRNKDLSQREQLELAYKGSRNNLLLVLIFSLFNIATLVGNLDLYFLFSASIPYAIVDFAMFLCGRYPEEAYTGEFDGMAFLPPWVLWVALAVALVILSLYLFCWLFSTKNRVGWLIAAVVLFSLDTIVMFLYYGITLAIFFDLLFHGWVLYCLISGIVAHNKLKKLPPEEESSTSSADTLVTDEAGTVLSTPVLRSADYSVKARLLAEGRTLNHQIQYRRVKRINELVIDGNVYDEIELLVEHGHALNALIDGHAIQAGFDGIAHSYIKVDGKVIAKKVRLY